MLTICYDPYSGTLGRFTRAEIFELVAEAGYEGINIPVHSGFLGELSTAEIDDAVNLAEKHELVAPTIGFGNHILTTPARKDEALQHFEIVLESRSPIPRRCHRCVGESIRGCVATRISGSTRR